MTPKPSVHDQESAREALRAMGGTILFEKVLTSSDANGTGRLVIPKSQAEAHFPHLEDQPGMVLKLTDLEGNSHAFRFRFWINNQSRMYLLENTSSVLQQYNMHAGDVLVFAKLADGGYAVCGRKGTKDDVSRKPAVRRSLGSDAGGSGGKAKRSRAGPPSSTKFKRLKHKQTAQAVQSMFTYWNGHSLPLRKDGVFRSLPNSAAAQDGDRVVAQCGAWSAIVALGDEFFQAFFETLDAATAALEAAQQGADEAELPPEPPIGTRAAAATAWASGAPRRAASAEPSVAATAASTAGPVAAAAPTAGRASSADQEAIPGGSAATQGAPPVAA